jgi:hypothetical protein
MAGRTKIDPVDRDVALIIDEFLSPAAQSRQFAAMAAEFLKEADETNRQVLGRVPRSQTYVNGREGADLASVKVPGVVVREYELVIDLLVFIAEELRLASPVGKGPDKRPGHPGFYRASHTLFADGTEVPRGAFIPDAAEYVFLSDVPYARRVEKRVMVYEKTASKAKSRFGNIARVRFAWRSPVAAYGGAASRHKKGRDGKWSGGAEWSTRTPAVVVTMGR